MHKKTIKRNVPTIPKIKAPQHLLRLRDEVNEHGLQEIALPGLQRKEYSRKISSPTSWDQTSASTSLSWPEEMENVATEKLLKQLDEIEKVLYNEVNQLSNSDIFEECVQWKTQTPHLRVVGKELLHTVTCKSADYNTNKKVQISRDHFGSPRSYTENDQLVKDTASSKSQRYKKLKEDVFNIILGYVNSQLFPNKNDDIDALDGTLTDVLKITPAPISRNGIFTRNSKSTRLGNKMSYYDHFGDYPLYVDSVELSECNKIKPEEIKTRKNVLHRRKEQSISASKLKGLQKEIDVNFERERLYTPQQGRNKLGTVFNEKIVVSPVPFAVSTRESFSTLKTIPIRFMNQTLQISTQGSARSASISHVKPLWKSNNIRITDTHSAWHAPVSPAVWPKNLRLAPIDTSRLPSSKNRSSIASPTVFQRSVKPLSPISRSIMPSTAKIMHEKNSDALEIQGKHVTAGQISKSVLFKTHWDYSPRSTANGKKKAQVKNEK